MTDNLKPVRDAISESKRKIEIEIQQLQSKLKDFGFNGVAIDVHKEYVRSEADLKMQETFSVNIKPLL